MTKSLQRHSPKVREYTGIPGLKPLQYRPSSMPGAASQQQLTTWFIARFSSRYLPALLSVSTCSVPQLFLMSLTVPQSGVFPDQPGCFRPGKTV